MGFDLLTSFTFYKETTTTEENGSWLDGVYHERTDTTTTYEAFEGLEEPYQSSETSILLPEGVDSSGAYLLFTDEELKTYSTVENDMADIVYFSNPNEDSEAIAYYVREVRRWRNNASFELFQTQYEYLILRQEEV